MTPTPTPLLPPASIQLLVLSISTQALMNIGAYPLKPALHWSVPQDVMLAKHNLETLLVLRDKTAGHLTPKEERYLLRAIADISAKLEEYDKENNERTERSSS